MSVKISTKVGIFETGKSDAQGVSYKNSKLLNCIKKKEFEGYNVVEGTEVIGDRAFLDANVLRCISLPESLKAIGKSAFMQCLALTEIRIPEGVTEIRERTFDGCSSLQTVSLPESLRSIEEYAFKDCKSLENITIPDGVEEIGEYAFAGCETLRAITLPASLRTLGKCCFDACKSLVSIRIADGLTEINDYTFDGCGALESIELPASVKILGKDPFGKGLKTLTINAPEIKISKYTFIAATGLKTIIVPAGRGAYYRELLDSNYLSKIAVEEMA